MTKKEALYKLETIDSVLEFDGYKDWCNIRNDLSTVIKAIKEDNIITEINNHSSTNTKLKRYIKNRFL